MWFNEKNQDKILLNYFPKGRAYEKASSKDSNFNKIVVWLSRQFESVIVKINTSFKALFLKKSKHLIEKWKSDYLIPNELFYFDNKENYIDLLVLRYFMRGNTEKYFKSIADIYEVPIVIRKAKDFYKERIKGFHDLVINQRYLKEKEKFANDANTIVFLLPKNKTMDILPHEIPHILGGIVKKINKVENIFKTIKSAEQNLIFYPLEAYLIEKYKDEIKTYYLEAYL